MRVVHARAAAGQHGRDVRHGRDAGGLGARHLLAGRQPPQRTRPRRDTIDPAAARNRGPQPPRGRSGDPRVPLLDGEPRQRHLGRSHRDPGSAGQFLASTVTGTISGQTEILGLAHAQTVANVTSIVQTRGAEVGRLSGISNGTDLDGVSWRDRVRRLVDGRALRADDRACVNLRRLRRLDQVIDGATVGWRISGFVVPRAGARAKLGVIGHDGDSSTSADAALEWNGDRAVRRPEPGEQFSTAPVRSSGVAPMSWAAICRGLYRRAAEHERHRHRRRRRAGQPAHGRRHGGRARRGGRRRRRQLPARAASSRRCRRASRISPRRPSRPRPQRRRRDAWRRLLEYTDPRRQHRG